MPVLMHLLAKKREGPGAFDSALGGVTTQDDTVPLVEHAAHTLHERYGHPR